MIDLKQMAVDIAMGGPVPRIISVAQEQGVITMRVVLAQDHPPEGHADQITYENPSLNNPKIAAYVRRFLRMAELEQAVIAAGQTQVKRGKRPVTD